MDTKKKVQHWTIAIVTIILIIWSFVGMDFGGIKASAGQIAGAIVAGIFHQIGHMYITEVVKI